MSEPENQTPQTITINGQTIALSEIFERLQLLENENIRLRRAATPVPTPIPVQSPPAPSGANEPRVAPPAHFTGDPKCYRTFINQLELLFLLNPSRYPNGAMKVGTAASYCSGVASTWFNTYLEDSDLYYEVLNDWDKFKVLFKSTFGPIDPAVTAAHEIRNLSQRNGSISVYASRFLQLRSDLDWNESALLYQFKSGLSNEIKDLLLHHDIPEDLDSMVKLAVRIDGRLQEHRQERSRRTFPSRPNNGNPSPPLSNFTPPRPNHSYAPPRPTGDMMDVDSVKRGPLTPQEREHRFKNGLCIVCGKAGHIKMNCPQRRQVNAVSTASPTLNYGYPVNPYANLEKPAAPTLITDASKNESSQ
jgi:hypothetical protein